jgi:predicted nuclease of predicted toxin-antitoxin system
MSVLKFYTDTHVDKQVAIQLRQKGVDIVRCQDVGLADADDETHLTYAAQEGRVLVTFDKGFRDRAFHWLAAGKSHSGVFVCKHDLQSEAGIGKIVTTCQFYHEAVEGNAASLDDFRNQVFDIE